MKRYTLFYILFFCVCTLHAQQDPVRNNTVERTVNDTLRQDTATQKSKLEKYLDAGREILSSDTENKDSVLVSVIPGDKEKIAKVAKVALPAASIIGSAVGLPFMGALAAAKKVSAVKKVYEENVPDEIKDEISSQIKDTKEKASQALKEVMKETKDEVKLLSSADLSEWKMPSANYSGIVPLGNNDYAVVDDKSASGGFYVFHIDIDSVSGKVISVSRSAFKGMTEPSKEDCEDIVYLPQCQSVWIASEANQTISEYSMDGALTGRELEIPIMFSKDSIDANRGFESLTYAPDSNKFYTTTEGALPYDGKTSDDREPLRIVCFDSTMMACAQWAYLMEKPALKTNAKHYVHGVPAILALGSNQMLVMERELSVPNNNIGAKTVIRLFWVDLDDLPPLDDEAVSLKSLPAERYLPKMEICSFTTSISLSRLNFANFEGMCLGPQLSDGHQTIILISDSQNGMGNSLYHLKDYIKVIIL